MEKLVLMSWSDSNMAGDDWTWFITLNLRKNGSYSVGAMQTSTQGPTYRLPRIYPLRTGSQVRVAIEQLFLDDPLAGEEIDWQKIITVLSKHVPELGREIEKTFNEDESNEEEIDLQFEENEEEHHTPISDWVGKAKWPLSPLSHHIGNPMDNARRRKLVFEFVHDYFTKNGRLPTGIHRLHHEFLMQFPES
jgi:hypothetical protein